MSRQLAALEARLSARSVMTGSLQIGIADNCLTNPECKLATTLTRFRQHSLRHRQVG